MDGWGLGLLLHGALVFPALLLRLLRRWIALDTAPPGAWHVARGQTQTPREARIDINYEFSVATNRRQLLPVPAATAPWPVACLPFVTLLSSAESAGDIVKPRRPVARPVETGAGGGPGVSLVVQMAVRFKPVVAAGGETPVSRWYGKRAYTKYQVGNTAVRYRHIHHTTSTSPRRQPAKEEQESNVGVVVVGQWCG